MPARRLNDVTIVIAAGVVMVLLGVAGAILAPAPDAVDAGASTFNAGRSGAKAAYVTLRELGYQAERSVEPITALAVDPPATVLVLTGLEPPSEGDRRALQRFLQDGGTVLATGANGADFLGRPARPGAKRPLLPEEDLQTYGPLTPAALAHGADQITMRTDGPAPAFDERYVPLYGNSDDRPVVVTAKVGDGRAVWWAAPTPLENAQIGSADNFRLLLNVVGPPGAKRVLFDEHYQGHRRSLWSYAAGTPLPWVGLQFGLVAVAAFLTFSRRHGPVRAPAIDPRTSPMEFVDMLGGLYTRAGARSAAVAAARARLRRTLAATCGVPPTSSDMSLAQAAAAKLGENPAAIADLLAASERAAADPDLEAARALELTRQLQVLAVRLAGVRSQFSI